MKILKYVCFSGLIAAILLGMIYFALAYVGPIHVVKHASITVIPNTMLPNEPNTRNELYVNISVV
jgi:branched-subunit amino acid permease